MAPRVLVVDDVDEMRVLIRRTLTAAGYEVDVASTLAQARALNPGGYDAVLVDARLGDDRGIDLVEELQAADPAAGGRCLVITGGVPGVLPDGVACVLKPFRPDQLLAAVRALARGQPPRQDLADESRPDEDRVPEDRFAGQTPGWWLLGVVRRLRERERAGVADFVHDGPVQELAAAVIELELMRRSAPPDQVPALDAVVRRLDIAAESLRWLTDEEWSRAQPSAGLAATLQQRAAWLVAALTVDAGAVAPPGATELPVIAEVVELMLLAMLPARPPARAHVTVRIERPVLHIALTVTPADEAQALPDPSAARASLDALAAALTASVHWTTPGPRWQVTLALRGPAR